jgi:hypothetical protein
MYAWISNFSAKIDFLWGLAQGYAQIIARAYMKYKDETNCEHFFVTFGSSLNILLRDADYLKTGLYLEDTCLQKLDALPSFLTAAETVLLESFGILANPILANNLTNSNGGGESIFNIPIIDFDQELCPMQSWEMEGK